MSPAEQPQMRHLAAIAMVAVGVALVALSVLWPRVSKPEAAWSAEQARQYQSTASRLHSLSHQSANQPPDASDPKLRAELDATRAEYERLRADLDTARERPGNFARWLRYAGLGLLAAGVILLLTGGAGPRRDAS